MQPAAHVLEITQDQDSFEKKTVQRMPYSALLYCNPKRNIRDYIYFLIQLGNERIYGGFWSPRFDYINMQPLRQMIGEIDLCNTI